MFRRLTLTMAAVAGLALASAGQAEDAPSTIRLGDVGFGFGTPFGVGLQAIADAKGFIAKEFEGTETTVSWTYFTGTGPAINEAFANDQIDFASYGAVPNIVGAAGGLDTVILASTQGTNIFAVARPDAGIETLSDLKGKRVALQKATIIHWAALEALKDAGVEESDFTLIDLKNADQLAAITAGSVDAVFGADFLLPLEQKGIAKVIFSSARDNPAVSGFGGFLVSRDFVEAYPDATQKVVDGYIHAAEWLADPANRDEAFEIWARAGTPVELIARSNADTDFAEAYNPRLDGEFERRYHSALEFALEQKLVRSTPDLESWTDGSFLNDTLARNELDTVWPERTPAVSN
ncbi:ABC transporter substrate-binding protein [Celeribacter indicus]|uniref:Putative sulfate ester transport system substrate-binding protein n=1 Tax=Celeribacter indicus TaxID=1208324 RepID=A0A0B5DVS0_9RHOB|nr:ABC transporter substrate-binding protein [Celeribacter indicus]AJE47094.1 putative sulfate ester transport system substrate-binding protein [Celeribacter indicus]SDW91063.1 sulfonate transport system substrate-binding protein [Celeribacter indicus]